MAVYHSKNLTERMNISSMNGKGYNFLLNTAGDVVIYPKFYEDEAYRGLMKFVNDAPEIIPDESGDQRFAYNGEKYYAHFEPLEINSWYLMTCAREQDVFEDANILTYNIFMAMGTLWLLILLGIFATGYSVYRSKRELRQAVFYDELLQIGNGNFLPVYFRKLPEQQFERMAYTIFDIDKFKEFNYLYGEQCGDDLLRYIVRVFQEELPDAHLFRYLADHFVALIECESQEEFQKKIERVLRRFAEDIDKRRIQPFDISAGVRKIQKGDTFRRVTSDALLAKSTIKGIQVQQYAFYDEALRHKRINYMEIESDFARALRDGEFHVYYQPKYDMVTGRITGAEALARWVKADGTVISPGTYYSVPVPEEKYRKMLKEEDSGGMDMR